MKLFLQTDRSEVVAALASSWILSRRGIKSDRCAEWDGTNGMGRLMSSSISPCSCALGIQSPCQMMIGVYNHLLSKVFRFHYHSQELIGSLGAGVVFFFLTRDVGK